MPTTIYKVPVRTLGDLLNTLSDLMGLFINHGFDPGVPDVAVTSVDGKRAVTVARTISGETKEYQAILLDFVDDQIIPLKATDGILPPAMVYSWQVGNFFGFYNNIGDAALLWTEEVMPAFEAALEAWTDADVVLASQVTKLYGDDHLQTMLWNYTLSNDIYVRAFAFRLELKDWDAGTASGYLQGDFWRPDYTVPPSSAALTLGTADIANAVKELGFVDHQFSLNNGAAILSIKGNIRVGGDE